MTNRALVIALLAVGAVNSAVAAAPVEPRTQTLEYIGGGVSAGEPRTSVVRAGDKVGAVVFRGGPERFVRIEIDDRHGLPVTGVVAQSDDTDRVHICGATEKPLRVEPFEKVTVFLMNGVCGDAGASVVTTGTVTATFVQK